MEHFVLRFNLLHLCMQSVCVNNVRANHFNSSMRQNLSEPRMENLRKPANPAE